MKPKYTIVEHYTYEDAGCDCCMGTHFEFYEIYSGEELISGTFYNKEDAFAAILELNNIEVSFE